MSKYYYLKRNNQVIRSNRDLIRLFGDCGTDKLEFLNGSAIIVEQIDKSLYEDVITGTVFKTENNSEKYEFTIELGQSIPTSLIRERFSNMEDMHIEKYCNDMNKFKKAIKEIENSYNSSEDELYINDYKVRVRKIKSNA